MDKRLRILLVEDSEEDTLLLMREIRRGGYEPECRRVETAEEMGAALSDGSWDLVISDYRLPQFSAPAALETLKESRLDLPFIIVSGKIGEDLAVAAMKAGAHDYLMKGSLSRLVPAIERELREADKRRKHRKAEEAIRRGKMEWESAFDSVSDLIFLSDLSGRIVRCNKRVLSYFRRDYRDLIGTRIAELFYGTEDARARAFQFPHKYQTVFSGEEEDLRFPTLPGYFNVSSYPMYLEEGELHGIVYIVKDITKRKKAEEEKRNSDRELLTLYAVAFRLNAAGGTKKILGELLFQIHNMLQIDFSAIHFLELGELRLKAALGLSRRYAAAVRELPPDAGWVQQVVQGRPIKAKGMPPELSEEAAEAAREMEIRAWCAVPLKIGTDVTGILTVAHRSDKSYSDREVFLLSSIANQLAILIENRTLYDRMREKAEELQRSRQALKENLQQVKKANIELGRLNAAKNSFIGMASHELKTPITSILGGVQFLLNYSGLDLTPEQLTIFHSVYEGITQLKGLVDDLLSISRIEANGISLQKRPLDPLALANEVYETFALPLSERRIRVHIDGEPALVPLDDGFARLVIRNLLENAIKFTPDDGEISITGAPVDKAAIVRSEKELRHFYPSFQKMVGNVQRLYRLDVVDNGIGIPVEERQRIFEKFYGVGDIAYHSSGKTGFMSKGSGLGLSIVKGIMDAHSGVVWVTAGPDGKGSAFSLLFPME